MEEHSNATSLEGLLLLLPRMLLMPPAAAMNAALDPPQSSIRAVGLGDQFNLT